MKIIDSYSRFVSHHPYAVMGVVILLIMLSLYEASTIKNVSQSDSDMLPDDIEVIRAFNVISDSFGGADTAMISIEVSPAYAGSDETRDIRDPELISYLKLLEDMAKTVEYVDAATGPATVLAAANGGILPRSKSEILDSIQKSPLSSQVISKDNTMAIIRLELSDNYVEDELYDSLIGVIDQVPMPPGLIVQPAGEVMTGPVLTRQMGADQAKTSMFSFGAIIIILLIMLRSIRYTAMPLLVIGVGVILAFGYIGLRGMNMTPTTSGVISMIIGIGIDFGIQTIIRFRQEKKISGATTEAAMTKTMNAVFLPMATTTVAALIGFKAMSMGQLTFLAELGNMMSYGITACFVAAITALPAMIVISEKINIKKILSEVRSR